MSVAFIFFIPTGALLSRYYKMVFSSSWLKVCSHTLVHETMWQQNGIKRSMWVKVGFVAKNCEGTAVLICLDTFYPHLGYKSLYINVMYITF